MARAESVLGVAARRRAGDTTNEDERDGGVGAWRHHGEEAVDETSTAGYDWTGWCSAGAEKQETARPAVLTTLYANATGSDFDDCPALVTLVCAGAILNPVRKGYIRNLDDEDM
jgi:hypothetical protein